MRPERLTQVDDYNDGVNVWRRARVAPAPEVADALFGYADYWERTTGFHTRRETPHGQGVLIFNLGASIAITDGEGRRLRVAPGEAFIAGAHLRPAFSHSGGTQAGVHVFLPLHTLRRITGVPMATLVDRVAPLDAFLGEPARVLGERLVEAADAGARVALIETSLHRRLASASSLCPRQLKALKLLSDRPDMDICGIAREVGWSRKHLAARIEDAIGVGPRCFRRLLRFQRITAWIDRGADPPDWAGLSCDAGYFDQSHMIREFREFAGMTPTAYRARILPEGGGLIEA